MNKPNYTDANIQTRVVVFLISRTSYRFPKEGLFGRGSNAREILRALGVSAIDVNARCGY